MSTSGTPGRSDPSASDTTVGRTPATKQLRRRQLLAALLLIAAAVALWSASRMVWATLTITDGLSPVRARDVKGSDWSPWLVPLALVFLAAIAAGAALRGWALRLVAVLVALGGVLAAIPAVSLMVSGDNDVYAAKAIDLSPRYSLLATTSNSWAGVVVAFGAALAVAGAVMLLRVAGGQRMSSKYQSPAVRRAEVEKQAFRAKRDREAGAAGATDIATRDGAPADGSAAGAPESERLLWDALDTGLDPTEDDGR